MLEHIKSGSFFNRGTVDWSVLKGTFMNDKIRPSDLDGMLEFGDGYVLMMEVKWTGTVIPGFIHNRFIRMSKSSRMKIIILWGDFGKEDDGVSVYPYQFHTMRLYSNGKVKVDSEGREDRPIDNDKLKQFLRQFKRWAESNPTEVPERER